MNLFIKMLISCFLFLGSMLAFAKQREPMLVLDMRNTPALTKHFHTTSDHLSGNENSYGLTELKIAGGSQFSKLAFDTILQRLGAKKITVVDLRQESHGFLNGNAISWYGFKNAANKDLQNTSIEEKETSLLNGLENEEIVTVNTILAKSKGTIHKTKPVEYAVHQVSTEKEFVTGKGSLYFRLYVEDFHAPTSHEVDRFLEMARQFPKNQWIYFHCRGGSGRTSLFMLMYDMMQNAKKVPLDEIMSRQTALGGKNILVLPEKSSFKYHAAASRISFIKQFYRYVKENNDNFATTFSDWLANSDS